MSLEGVANRIALGRA